MFRIIVCSLYFVIILAINVFCQNANHQSQSNINYYLQNGKKFVDEGNYEAAALALSNVIKTNPENLEANYLLGRTSYFLEKFTDSIKYLNIYLSSESPYSDAYLYRGLSFYNTSQKREATNDLKTFIKYSSDQGLKSIAEKHLKEMGYSNDDIRFSITNSTPKFDDINNYLKDVATSFGDEDYSKFEGMWELGIAWNHKYWERVWLSYELSFFSAYGEVENTISNPPDDYIEMTLDGIGFTVGPQVEIVDGTFFTLLGELKGGYNIILFSREPDRNSDSFTTSTFGLSPALILQFGPRKSGGRILGISYGYEVAKVKNTLFDIDLSRNKIEFDFSLSLFF